MIIRRTFATVLATTVGLSTPGVAQAMPGVDRIPGADAVQACVQKQGLEDREPGWINRYGDGKSYADAGQEYQNSSAPSCYSAEQLSQILVDITQDLVNGIDIQGVPFKSPGVSAKNYGPNRLNSTAHFGGKADETHRRFEARDRLVAYLKSIGVDVSDNTSQLGKTPENQESWVKAYIYPIAGVSYEIAFNYNNDLYSQGEGQQIIGEDSALLQVFSPQSYRTDETGEQTFYAQ